MGLTKESLSTRVCHHTDYKKVVELFLSHSPFFNKTPADLASDEKHVRGYDLQRFVVESDSRVIGFYEHLRHPFFKDGGYGISGVVDKNSTKQGFGAFIYDNIMQALSKYFPKSYITHIDSKNDWSLNFLLKRGFKVERQTTKQELNLKQYFLNPHRIFLPNGIEIKTLDQLFADQNYLEKLYRLECEIVDDIPRAGGASLPTREYFKNILQSPQIIPKAYFVAVTEDNRYVGATHFFGQKEKTLFTGTTGVIREFRGKGIAIALKHESFLWAQANGIETLSTQNDNLNEPILGLNRKLGFAGTSGRMELINRVPTTCQTPRPVRVPLR